MKKFVGFKESVLKDPRFNPPAKRVGYNHGISAQIKKNIQFVVRGFKNLFDYGAQNENKNHYTKHASSLEPELFKDECGVVCNLLRRNRVNAFHNSVPKKSCGMEGCAYFYGDIVLKCTFGEEEWTVASAIKGDPHFHILDVDQDRQLGVYLILSKKLNLIKRDFMVHVDVAGEYMSQWFNMDSIENSSQDEKGLVEYYFNKNKFAQHLQKEAEEFEEKEFVHLALTMFDIVVKLYHKTGRFLSQDMHAGNLGTDNNNQLKLLDFGWSFKPGTRTPKVGTNEIPKVTTDLMHKNTDPKKFGKTDFHVRSDFGMGN